MATTTEDRHGTSEERPAGAPPAPGGSSTRRRRSFRETWRDMYFERKDGPVTMAERRRSALIAVTVTPLLLALVGAIQIWGRDREVEATWWAGGAVVTVVLTVLGFAFPRFSPGGNALLLSTDWSKESRTSKVVAIIAMLALMALFVWRAVHRMD